MMLLAAEWEGFLFQATKEADTPPQRQTMTDPGYPGEAGEIGWEPGSWVLDDELDPWESWLEKAPTPIKEWAVKAVAGDTVPEAIVAWLDQHHGDDIREHIREQFMEEVERWR